MKATYRAKYAAQCALKDGHFKILIQRCNRLYSVYLEDILSTPLHENVPEHDVTHYRYSVTGILTFRDMMQYK